MDEKRSEGRPLADEATAETEHLAASLREELRGLAARLAPFPSFLGMAWLQAVEVEPPEVVTLSNRGCLVVCPDGELYELVLRLLPGAEAVSDPDPVEELVPLDLTPLEYVVCARTAIEILGRLIHRNDESRAEEG